MQKEKRKGGEKVKLTISMDGKKIQEMREEKISPLLFLLKAVVSCVEKHAEVPIQAATIVLDKNEITKIKLQVDTEDKEQAESTLPFCPIVKTLKVEVLITT
jgi:uncharacterized OsmC-like protein